MHTIIVPAFFVRFKQEHYLLMDGGQAGKAIVNNFSILPQIRTIPRGISRKGR